MDKEESGKKNSSFKVEDKRRFSDDGTEKDTVESHQTGASQAVKEQPDEKGTDQEQITLGSFIMSLATQGMMQLGEMPAPDGYQIPVDLAHAKQTIDLIAMLQEKTKGNQDQFEEQLFTEILYSLRMAFVKKKNG